MSKNTAITFLNPVDTKSNTVSGHLNRLSGDGFSSQAFHSVHKPDSLTSAGVIEHKETGRRFFVPFKVHPRQEGPVRSDEMRCIGELARIQKYSEGVGGYDWGNTPGPDGNFGKENLDKLVELGLAERTGGDSKNNMGGVWPEVRVTELGASACKAYRRWQRDQSPEVPGPSL